MKEINDFTYIELVDYVAIQLHSALLSGGGKEFRSAIYVWLDQAIRWSIAQNEKKRGTEKPPGSTTRRSTKSTGKKAV